MKKLDYGLHRDDGKPEKIDLLQAHQFLQTVNRKEPRPLTGVEIFDDMALQMEELEKNMGNKLNKTTWWKNKKTA